MCVGGGGYWLKTEGGDGVVWGKGGGYWRDSGKISTIISIEVSDIIMIELTSF